MCESIRSWENRAWKPEKTLASVSLESTPSLGWVGAPVLAVCWDGLVQPHKPHPWGCSSLHEVLLDGSHLVYAGYYSLLNTWCAHALVTTGFLGGSG